MAEQANEAPQEETLELTEEVQTPEVAEEQTPAADDEEIVVSFGDEAPPASSEPENSTIREMRQALREKEAKIRELEQGKLPQEIEVGKKPTLESCEYDEEKFEREFNAWADRKSAAEQAKSEAQKAEEEVRQRYLAKVQVYGEQKSSLAVKDFDQAEAEVRNALTDAQQAVLIEGAEDKAKLIYALGKHPEKLKQLAASKNLIEFAFAASKLETQTKMDRRPRTSPESTVRGSAPLASGSDKTLERLEAEAERTGNRTKVIAYKREQRAKSQR